MRRAQGFQRIKQFQHKAKVRRLPDEDQSLKLSAWDEIQDRKPKGVDVERANARGTIYTQPFDPTPRMRTGRRNPVHDDAFSRYVREERHFSNQPQWAMEMR